MDKKFKLEDLKTIPDIVHEYSHKNNPVPIVIDNGSYQCRAGWATSVNPQLVYKNIVAKNRANRKERDWDVQVGNEIADIESVRWMVRSPYDFNVVVNFSAQETLFDYAFKNLGVDAHDSVPHPIVLTEPVANPLYCHKNMMELLFEAYSVPSVACGIDSLFSFHQNNIGNCSKPTGLILSCGFQSTHVVPVVEGDPDIKNCLRLNLGGYNCSAYLQWLLQYRHPQFLGEFTLTRMETLIHKLGHVALNYGDAVKEWTDTQFTMEHRTEINFLPRANNNTTLKPGYMQRPLLALEKKLKQTEYKLYEVECILEIEQEFPEGAAKACLDVGCGDMADLKQLAAKIQTDIDQIQAQLDEQYKLESSTVESKEQFTLGIEKIQAPEIIFQPSLVGYDQCGLSDCVETVLQRYTKPVQELLSNNVFVTGGNSKINGFLERVSHDIREIRPFTSTVSVTQALDPSLDAWKGAAKWACDQQNNSHFITKQEYDERGSQFYKVHPFSNRWVDPVSSPSVS